MIVAAVLLLGVGVWLRRRRHRRAVLAGLDSTRPTYTLAPSVRFSTRLRDHRL